MPLKTGPEHFYYLGGPYSHPDPLVRLYRAKQLNQAAAALMSKGVLVFSPISHGHPIQAASNGELGTDWEAWQSLSVLMLNHSKCAGLIVLRLPGWQASKGLNEEIAINKRLGRTVEMFLEPPA